MHAIPEASLVFDLLPKTPAHVNARGDALPTYNNCLRVITHKVVTAFIALDGSMTVSLDADLSTVSARVDAGMNANAVSAVTLN